VVLVALEGNGHDASVNIRAFVRVAVRLSNQIIDADGSKLAHINHPISHLLGGGGTCQA
jgi:hypothetical protein